MTNIGLLYHTLSLAKRLERICFHVASFIFIIPPPATREASLALAPPLPPVQYHYLEVSMKVMKKTYYLSSPVSVSSTAQVVELFTRVRLDVVCPHQNLFETLIETLLPHPVLALALSARGGGVVAVVFAYTQNNVV